MTCEVQLLTLNGTSDRQQKEGIFFFFCFIRLFLWGNILIPTFLQNWTSQKKYLYLVKYNFIFSNVSLSDI